MFKKFSIVLFAVATSFGFVATSLPAYAQCANCQGSGASLPSFVSTQLSAGSYIQSANAPSSIPSIRSVPMAGTASAYRAVPYRISNVNSHSQIPFYLLSKPERNGGHGR